MQGLDSETDTAVAHDEQRALWRGQSASLPLVLGGKDEMFARTLDLLRELADGGVADLDATPTLADVPRKHSWRKLSPSLRTPGLVENRRGILQLTADGEELLATESKSYLADLLAQRVRLFAETLGLLIDDELSVQEIDHALVDAYKLPWKSLNNTRPRLTWLEALGLVEWLGGNRLTATTLGRSLHAGWITVAPEAIGTLSYADPTDVPGPPPEIAAVLDELTDANTHAGRTTYNIWVPSPASDPNKIANMRLSIGAAIEPIERDELLTFIANRFGLKRSSVDSMLPFMRAGGFLQEVRRGVFAATLPAKAWLDTGADLDFVRILHRNLRFVGELIEFARSNVSRADAYTEGGRYGMNKEKVRWTASFLIEAGLLIETSWSSLQATPAGLRFVETLPLAQPTVEVQTIGATREVPSTTLDIETASQHAEAADVLAAQLRRTAVDPGAGGLGSGEAFEIAIADAFNRMGFTAKRISGSGDTDVLVQWYGDDRQLRTAIVDAKSSASGQIAHTHVSDVAISAHQDKHSADYVAIVAPAFAGLTIRDMAAKKRWALITADELAETLIGADRLGLRPGQLGALLEASDGGSRVSDMIESGQRSLEIFSVVVSRLATETQVDEALSPRDISLMERNSDLAPTLDELSNTFDLLTRLDDDVVRVVEDATDVKHRTYQIGDARAAIRRLRSIASAIERGLSPPSL